MAKATCSVEGCDRPAGTRGWCNKHYTRWRRHGDPVHPGPTHAPAVERFWRKVDRSDECWMWTGGKNGTGYGRFTVDNRTVYPHRFSYETFVGPIPDGLILDHLCRNRACVRPDHLEPVTYAENIRRGVKWQLTKTHCPQGHPYDEANTGTNAQGHRRCLACHRACEARRRQEALG